MASFKDKISHLINQQAPEFVLEQHPKFLEFVKTYFSFMESSELTFSSIQTTDGIQLETETAQENVLLLDGSRIDTDRTQLDSGDKIILENSSFGKFTRGEIITGQTSKATATILAEDLTNNRVFISAQDKFVIGETVVGSTSSASAVISNYKPNPVTNIQELLNFRDPDKTISSFLTKFRNEFLNTLPETLNSNVSKRKLIKNVKSLYRAKGTDRAHQIFFRLLFNEDSQTIYPREQMLRVSDGKWNTSLILRAISSTGDTLNLIGRTITGQTSGAIAAVENVFKFQIGENEVSEFILNSDTISGTFQINEEIRGTETDEDDAFIKASITGIPSLISITNDGTLYSQGETITVTGGGTGATINVDSIGTGGITNFYIENSGTNYEIGDSLVFSSGNATAKVAVVNGGITQETSTSTTEDHIILEDETVRGDSYTGNKIIQETGTGSGDITDIRIINAENNYSSLPTITVTSTSGSSAQIYCYGSEIGRVQSTKINESGAGYEASPSPPTIAFRTNGLIIDRVGAFLSGETITGVGTDGSTAITATFVSLDTNTNIITMSGASGAFGNDTTITGSGGATATIKISDLATGTSTVSATATTSGLYLNEDGHVSETTMKIQDSLYYQDFSYVIKVGRSINDWRDSYKKTMHTGGFYFTAQVDIVSQIDMQLRNITTINSGLNYTPIAGIINTLFSTIFGRRLGTIDDGTTLRASPQAGVDPDFNDSTSEHFTVNTRDLTLRRHYKLNNLIIIKERTGIRGNTTKYGRAVAGPNMKSLGDKLLNEYFSTQVTLESLGQLRLTGTLNTSIDGELSILGDFNEKLKTSFTIPSEIFQVSGDSFDETFTTFDDTTKTFDVA
jgi:hypothetical protein